MEQPRLGSSVDTKTRRKGTIGGGGRGEESDSTVLGQSRAAFGDEVDVELAAKATRIVPYCHPRI